MVIVSERSNGLIFVLKDDFDEERETNLAAVVASLQLWQDEDVVKI